MRAVILANFVMTAALIAIPQTVRGQAQGMAYCLESQVATRSCVYESLDRCQQMAHATIGSRCVANPVLSATTGRGGLDAPRGTGPHSLDRVPAPPK
jgi:hypothetical protein